MSIDVNPIIRKTGTTTGQFSAGIFPDVAVIQPTADVIFTFGASDSNAAHLIECYAEFQVTAEAFSNVDSATYYLNNTLVGSIVGTSITQGDTLTVIAVRTAPGVSTVTLTVNDIETNINISAPALDQAIMDPLYNFGGEITLKPGVAADIYGDFDAYSTQKDSSSPGSSQYRSAYYSRRLTTGDTGWIEFWPAIAREVYIGLLPSTTTPVDHLNNRDTYRAALPFAMLYLTANRFIVYESNVSKGTFSGPVFSQWYRWRIRFNAGAVTYEYSSPASAIDTWTPIYTSAITVTTERYRVSLNPSAAAARSFFPSVKASPGFLT